MGIRARSCDSRGFKEVELLPGMSGSQPGKFYFSELARGVPLSRSRSSRVPEEPKAIKLRR